jgi:hypothetical protein
MASTDCICLSVINIGNGLLHLVGTALQHGTSAAAA